MDSEDSLIWFIQRIYSTNRTEMFLVYALRKVNNLKCKKGWIQQPSRVKTSRPSPPSPASRAGPHFFQKVVFKRRVPFYAKYIFCGFIPTNNENYFAILFFKRIKLYIALHFDVKRLYTNTKIDKYIYFKTTRYVM